MIAVYGILPPRFFRLSCVEELPLLRSRENAKKIKLNLSRSLSFLETDIETVCVNTKSVPIAMIDALIADSIPTVKRLNPL